MDPYLEHPDLWPDVHNRLIAALADDLGERLRPRYYARLEERTYVVEPEGLLLLGRPDVTVTRGAPGPSDASPARPGTALLVEVPTPDRIRETWLEVRAAGSGEVVTVVEMLSPTNKRPGEGRGLYERKRMQVLGSRTHLVEVDLIRAGDPMPVLGAEHLGSYRILLSRSDTRPRAELFVFGVRDPIPSFPLPLRNGDDEPEVDLGSMLSRLYDRAAYDLSVDYSVPPVPALSEDDEAWSDRLLRETGRRPS